jgi:hypothetical protein
MKVWKKIEDEEKNRKEAVKEEITPTLVRNKD